jgi:hypothetical protein
MVFSNPVLLLFNLVLSHPVPFHPIHFLLPGSNRNIKYCYYHKIQDPGQEECQKMKDKNMQRQKCESILAEGLCDQINRKQEEQKSMTTFSGFHRNLLSYLQLLSAATLFLQSQRISSISFSHVHKHKQL